MSRGNPEPWFRPCRNTYFVTQGGKQINLRTADKAEAFRLWHELMAKDEPEPVKPLSIAVVVLLAEFAEWSQRNNRDSTYEWRRGFLDSFLKTLSANLLAVDVRPFHVTKWLDQHPTWGANSRYGAIATIKRAFQWGAEQGYLE